MPKKQDTKLVVSEMHVANVLGIRKREIVPGRITKFSGKNGSGKTSPLEAIKTTLGGGNLAKLRNIHAPEDEESEVVLVLEGPGSESYRVTKKGGKTARVQARVGDTQAFEEVPRPAEWLASLYDREGANPLTYLNAKDTERARLLLEALPLEMDRAELAALLGADAKHVHELPKGLHPLKELELIVDELKRACTGINVNARGKADAAEQTRRKLPAQIPADPAAALAALGSEVETLAVALGRDESAADAAEAKGVEEAEAAYRLEEERVKGEFKNEAAKLRAEAERQIAAIKQATDDAVSALGTRCGEKVDAAEMVKDDAVASAHYVRTVAREAAATRRLTLQTKRDELAQLRAMAQEGTAARALQQQAETFEREAGELKDELKRLRGVADAVEAFGRRLSDSLPIPGLQIVGDEIRVDGVLFEQLNLGARIEVACRVACLRAKEQRLPLLFVDGAESLDSEHLGALVKFLDSEGVQAFVARVQDHELEVETVGEAVTA